MYSPQILKQFKAVWDMLKEIYNKDTMEEIQNWAKGHEDEQIN